ncbi:hypothetical protein CALVIDRAFT_300297 [Calocera viscosa TUFC12733]|uniref:Uncharacterized protein n=1 Tax=Calocera viscosa (strain TUFC12733) TaxID=1330018 RepID=A0A167IHM3_CALVF|nr:hypothetical protein CALVIDRAFT_300297 [Calocera viscosa TUFC12733]
MGKRSPRSFTPLVLTAFARFLFRYLLATHTKMKIIIGRGRSKSAPPAFAQGTMMGYVDSTPIITAETYNLAPSRSRSRAPSHTSRRSSIVSSLSAYSALPSSPRSPHALPDDTHSVRSSLALPDLSPVSAAFSLSSTSEASECPTCRSLAHPPRASSLLRRLRSRLFGSPEQPKPVYMDQAHWSYFFPRAAHEVGCGCALCVRSDPGRVRGEEERARRVRAYERRPSVWGEWRKGVVWSRAARERRRLEGEGGVQCAVKVSRLYEVEW